VLVASIGAGAVVWFVIGHAGPVGRMLSAALQTAGLWLPVVVIVLAVATLIVWRRPQRPRPPGWPQLKPLPA
jgi:hypothetical protein